jgi:hypothetical protein
MKRLFPNFRLFTQHGVKEGEREGGNQWSVSYEKYYLASLDTGLVVESRRKKRKTIRVGIHHAK